MPLSEAQLEQAAYRLLTSNTIRRYTRMAKASAQRLEMRLDSESLSDDDLLKSANRLWREVRQSDERTMAEVKLAVVLAAVRNIASEEVDELYTRIGTSTSDVAIWLAALARELLAERPKSVDLGSAEHLEGNPSEGLSFSDAAADAAFDGDQERREDAGDDVIEIVGDR